MRERRRSSALRGRGSNGGVEAWPLDPVPPRARADARAQAEPQAQPWAEPKASSPEPELGTVTEIPPAAEPPKPPRPRIAGPLEAFLRHPFVTLLPVVALVAGAVLLGLERDPEYTAHSRITVGNTDVNAFLLEKVVAGNQAIAASYARAIEAEPVARAAGAEVGISPAEAADRLNGTQIPGSTLINVEAKGPSSVASIELANAGAQALIDYITRINRSNEAPSLFKRYKEAQGEARRAERRTEALLRSSQRNSRKATRARIEQDLATLRATDLAERYRAASLEASAASRLTLIAPAADSDSDRREVLDQLLVAGAAGGLVLGLALALLLANWRVLRTLRNG